MPAFFYDFASNWFSPTLLRPHQFLFIPFISEWVSWKCRRLNFVTNFDQHWPCSQLRGNSWFSDTSANTSSSSLHLNFSLLLLVVSRAKVLAQLMFKVDSLKYLSNSMNRKKLKMNLIGDWMLKKNVVWGCYQKHWTNRKDTFAKGDILLL